MTSTSEVRICCGDAVGTLSLTSGRVSCQGQDVSTTDFERIGGRASSKKWKQSVRVISGDGTAGKLIGDWLTDRGLDIKNNRLINLGELYSASPGVSIAPKSTTQPHSPMDVRRELATPVNSKMHSIFSGSKPIMKGQRSPTLQHCSQSQGLQHQQHAQHDSTPTPPAATLLYPPFQQHSMQGPAQQQTSQAQGALCESVSADAAVPQPGQAQSAGLCAHGGTPLQASGQLPPSTPVRYLPAPKTPGASPQNTIGLQAQQRQHHSEPSVSAAPLVSTHQMQESSKPVKACAVATAVQACSASIQAQSFGPTLPLAATAAEGCTVQTLQQQHTWQSQADAVKPTQQALKQMLPKRTLMHVPQARSAEALTTDLLQHLQLSYPGFIPGDSTAELPRELVKKPQDSTSLTGTPIDMATVTEEELMAMSGISADAPLRALLLIPPGIIPSREAHMTGHRPLKRQRPTIAPLSPDEAAAQIGQYMAGELKDEPWHAFGLGKAPTVAGRDLNLKQLYKAVQSCGGFASCVATRSFAKVTTKLGIDKTAMTNASFLLRNHYIKFLLAYEQQMEILASAEGAETRADKALVDASSWPANSFKLAAGNGSSAVEDAEVRRTATPGGWSGETLQGEAVALTQISVQESRGMPPLQDSTAVAPEPRTVSSEVKAVPGVGCPATSSQLLAIACIKKEATSGVPSNNAAAAGGPETLTA